MNREEVVENLTKYIKSESDLNKLLDLLVGIKEQSCAKNFFRINDIYSYNMQNNQLYCDGIVVNLTKKEYLFLSTLIKNRNKIVLKTEIKDAIWGSDLVDDTLIRSLLKRLRVKTFKGIVETIDGLGYKIGSD